VLVVRDEANGVLRSAIVREIAVAVIAAGATIAAALIARWHERREKPRASRIPPPPRSGPRRVLVVEDRALDRQFMVAWLAGIENVTVTGVATVAEADEEMARGDIAVAVIDVGLPGPESGYDLARRRPGSVRVVLVSARVERVEAMRDPDHGIEAYDKIAHADILMAVERALAGEVLR
jgi:CheY-like chemotaxis protein